MGKSGSGKTTGSGLPEKFSIKIGGYRIVDDVVFSPSGREIKITGFDEPSAEAVAVAKRGGIDDAVVVNKMVLPRAVAEKALEQGKKATENYNANMKKNVAGLKEIDKAKSDNLTYQQELGKAIERGGVNLPKPVENKLPKLAKKYPRAYAYSKAEGYANSSNYDKSAIGKKAMAEIRQGGDYKKAIEKMEREWKESAEKSMWNN